MTGNSSRPDFIFYLGMLYLLYLAPPLVALWNSRPGAATVAVVTGVLVVFVATYVWLMRALLVTGGAGRAYLAMLGGGIAALSAIAAGLVLAFGAPWLGLFIYASVAAGFAFPVWPAVGSVAAIAIASAGIGLASGAPWADVGPMAGLTAAIGVGMIGTAQLIVVNRELRTARLELARLAVAEERLRIARDLHDLLGHSLSLIAVKSELAGRLVTAGSNAAGVEVHEIEEVARAALLQVRDAVGNYRQPTLVSELESARRMLAAAGITCQVDNDWPALPVVVEAALSWALREGVTNVIRHGRGQACVIRVVEQGDTVVLEVVDDGRRRTAGPAPGNTNGEGRTTGSGLGGTDGGSGLSGVAERVAQVGGVLSAGPNPGGGFRLTVTVSRSGDTLAPA